MQLICYLSNGYPTIEASVEMSKKYVLAGCDIIEVDLPSSNPFLESNFIKDRMKKALENCDDYDKYFDGIIRIKKDNPNTRIILLAYENTVVQIGIKKFISFCLNNDLLDLIYVGFENNKIKEELISKGIKVSCYVQFQMDEKEVNSAKLSNGFVYLQAKPNEFVNSLFPKLEDCINYLRKTGISRPIYCGVGISTCQDVLMAKESKADGVFIGSAILKLHENIPKMIDRIKEFKTCCI